MSCPNTYYTGLNQYCGYYNGLTYTYSTSCSLYCANGITSGTEYTLNSYSTEYLYFPYISCCSTVVIPPSVGLAVWLIVIISVVPCLICVGCIAACVVMCRRRRQQDMTIVNNMGGSGGYQQPLNSGQDVVYQQQPQISQYQQQPQIP